ncbi:MAG: methyltransferase domain-containing protein, partial [Nevskiaceae bacterium]
QHELWRPRMLAGWDRAGFKEGMRIVDVGAGPGYATVDLAARVGPRGEVVAVERSTRFAAFGMAQCRARGLAQVRYVEHDVMQPLPARDMDASWCRWVGSFVAAPERLAAHVAAALKPGGVALFHEYADYRTWRMAPHRPLLEEFVGHVMASWRESGSEPDVARELPALLEAHGMRVRQVDPIIWTVGPHDPLWRWLAAYVETGPRRLLELGRVDEAWIARLHAELREAERDGVTRMTTPMLFEILAQKA